MSNGIDAKSLQALTVRWRDLECGVRPGVSAVQIGQIEKTHGVTIPPDLRSFYLDMNGIMNWDTGTLFVIWPIEHIVPLPGLSAPGYPVAFAFGDFSIGSEYLFVRFDADAPQGVIFQGGEELHFKIANSFSDFLHLWSRGEFDL